MKKRLYPLFVLLSVAACSQQPQTAPPSDAPASTPPTAAAAPTLNPEQAAKAETTKRATALTQEQIMQSHDPAALSKLGEIYAETGDAEHMQWTLQRLTQLFPNSGNLRLQLAMIYASQGKKSETYDTLLRLLNQGYYFDIGNDARFEGAHGTKVWDYLVKTFANNNQPFGQGSVAFDLPKGDNLIESIAWDPKRKQFLVGSVRDGSIGLVDNKGNAKSFITADASNGLMAVFGLAVDAAHDRLYAISNGVAHFNHFDAAIVGKAGVFEFVLSSGKFVRSALLPVEDGKHILSSITVDANGKVYVADGVVQQIYQYDNGALKLLTGNAALTGIRGLAVSGDGRTLYFADVALGIFGIDLGQDKPFSVNFNADRLTLGGIDGLYWYDGTLIAIQNDMSPKRVMRLKLSDDGRSIVAAQPLDAAQAAFGVPTVGTVVGDDLYFIANSQRGLYNSLGVLTDASKLEPEHIFSSNLRFNWDAKAPATRIPHHYTDEELRQIRNEPPKPFDEQQRAAPPATDATKPAAQGGG